MSYSLEEEEWKRALKEERFCNVIIIIILVILHKIHGFVQCVCFVDMFETWEYRLKKTQGCSAPYRNHL